MELTDNEKRWLRGKELAPRVYCVWCHKYNLCSKTCKSGWCPTDYTPADDFEARVAAKLANIHFGTEDCAYCSNHINVNEYCGECKTASSDKRCLACRLKYARLKVEEEMDAG